MMILDKPQFKMIKHPGYNLLFNKENGYTMRWGVTEDDDPDFSPLGPEIIDMEISSAADNDVNTNDPLHIVADKGCAGPGCRKFCYKANKGDKSVHMSLNTFRNIMNRMPKTVCSIAFGVISPIKRHPQIWEILADCRYTYDVVPNVTINEKLDDKTAIHLSALCGAVAVSVNPDNKEMAYDTISKLSIDNGMDQVNIHIVLSNSSVDFVKSVVDDISRDSRLLKLNALVMLSFKDKAKTACMDPITSSYYREVIDYCTDAGINFGFDSCSAKCYLEAIKDHPQRERLEQYVEPCESMMFSAYIDVNAKLYACLFLEGMNMWQDGVNVLDYDNFVDIWNSEKVQEWRKLLLSTNRGCPEYRIGQ